MMQHKSEQPIFVDYSKNVKSYRLFVPQTLEVIFQRDVQFDEHPLASLLLCLFFVT